MVLTTYLKIIILKWIFGNNFAWNNLTDDKIINRIRNKH